MLRELLLNPDISICLRVPDASATRSGHRGHRRIGAEHGSTVLTYTRSPSSSERAIGWSWGALSRSRLG